MKQTVEEVLVSLGNFGALQLITTSIFSLYQFIACVVAFSVSIFLKVPKWGCISDQCTDLKRNFGTDELSAFCQLQHSDFEWSDRTNIATEYGIYCDNAYLAALSITYYFVGYALGTTMLGVSADKYGRKAVVVPTLVLYTFVTALVSVSTSYDQFLVLRGISGVLHGGLQNVTHVLQAELIPPKYRNACNTIKEGMFGFGLTISALMLYYITSWRTVFFLLALLLAVCALVVAKFLPESPFFFASKGEMKLAMGSLSKISRINNVKLPTDLVIINSAPTPSSTAEKESIFEILRVSFRTKMSVLSLFEVFFTNTLLLYCLSYHVSAVPGDVFVNSFMMGLSSAPAYYWLYMYGDKFGRRKCLIFLYCFTISCLFISWCDVHGTPLIGPFTLQLMAFVTARSCMLAVSSLMYLYTSEVFPSSARSGLVGVSSMIARGGGILSSYVLILDSYNPSMVYLICIATASVALILLCLLPDTNGRKLPETFAECDALLSGRESAAVNARKT